MNDNHQIKVSVLTSLYRCEEYLERYFIHVREISNLHEVEFIFIHNDPTPNEQYLIELYLNRYNAIHYQYVSVQRESLYKSWNRGIQLAKGEYVAIWNVDDIRCPESLREQCRILDCYTDIGLTYGDYYISKKYGTRGEIKAKTIKINRSSWFKKFQGGCFLMWRKSIHHEIGYCDEQFISSGDQDLWYRVVETFDVERSEISLGTFLAEPNKGISKTSNLPSIEKIIIGLRYGFFTYIDIWGWYSAFKKYSPSIITYNCSQKMQKKRQILKYRDIRVYLYSFMIIIASIFRKE